MKNGVILRLAYLLLVSTSQVHASDWGLVEASEKDFYFVDFSSIKKDASGITHAWTQSVSRDSASTKVLWFYKCESDEAGLKSYVKNKSDGSSDGSLTIEFVKFEPVAPDSINSSLLNVICADDPISMLDKPYQIHVRESVSPIEVSKILFKAVDSAKLKSQKHSKK